MSLWQTLTLPFRPGPRRPLATRQPKRPEGAGKVPLGLEATDMRLVDRVNRQNAALEGVSANVGRSGFARMFVEHARTDIEPLPDDETYAARYYRAHIDRKEVEKDD